MSTATSRLIVVLGCACLVFAVRPGLAQVAAERPAWALSATGTVPPPLAVDPVGVTGGRANADAPLGLEPGGFVFANGRLRFGIDLSFGLVHDDTLMETMGRERQIKPAFINLSVSGTVNDHLSFVVVVNPVNDGVVPRPYVPGASDRRIYFFPNQPEGRGVVSDPEGLYKVDDYKFSGFDPILQQGLLRVGYLDIHSAPGPNGRQFGALVGRAYVRQGFGVDEVTWYTAKDLTHIQRINFQADNGAFLYMTARRFRLDLATVTGNGNSYHDYGYFDFTDEAEDKNSAIGVVGTARWLDKHFLVGVSYRKNYINSRIEDSVSLQLSKHNDDAIVASVSVSPVDIIRLYGEYARYTWGIAATSVQLLPGPAVVSPVEKSGYYIGVEVVSPPTPLGRWKGTVLREELSRDDSLVAYAAANRLFGVSLGKRERTTILKVETELKDHLSLYGFWSDVSNPFPELSALKPITGAGSDIVPSGRRYGFGVRLRM